MNKILITVIVPSLEEKYDIYLPISKTIKVAKELLIKTINELSGGYFPLNKTCVLMSSDGIIYADNTIVKENKIKNGDVVVLI